MRASRPVFARKEGMALVKRVRSWSVGVPNMVVRGESQVPDREEMWTLEAWLLRSLAMERPELPTPTTNTRSSL